MKIFLNNNNLDNLKLESLLIDFNSGIEFILE